eukprot:m.59289 g.59289  ORF g.59289 m.59289 type:complete len:53 (-) comp13815_c0_seq1:2071-2229(-)
MMEFTGTVHSATLQAVTAVGTAEKPLLSDQPLSKPRGISRAHLALFACLQPA